MTSDDRLALIRAAVPVPDRAACWAELGAGDGAFTLPLAARLGRGARVLAVDRDRPGLERLLRAAATSGGARVETLAGDFTGELPLPELDGVLMANSLHYVARRRQAALLSRLARRLRPGGRLVVVEYDLARGNPWVPHPVPADAFSALARRAGLTRPEVVAWAPSRYWGRAYCGLALRGADGAREP
ncbi:MAG TPA: class I SAM-dependent methyltransferase [Trueperaceae bacterium]|nr:class I SAM-dependent methyltransferase [Trueperaceae bacterium]